MCAKLFQLCATLCNPKNCIPPGSSVHGILQARMLEWVAISFFRRSCLPKKRIHFSYIAAAAAKSLQSCPTLCDPIDGSPPGSAIPGILQAKHWSGLPFPFLCADVYQMSISSPARYPEFYRLRYLTATQYLHLHIQKESET